MARAFYFEKFQIIRKVDGTYKFNASSDLSISAPSDRTNISSIQADVDQFREVKFDITEETKGQDFECGKIDFTNYERYDMAQVVITKNGQTFGRDPKGAFVIKKNTPYPPPDGSKAVNLKLQMLPINKNLLSATAVAATDLNEIFDLIRINGNRISDGIYELEFKIRDSSESPDYLFDSYKTVYDEHNYIPCIVLFVKKAANPGEGDADITFSSNPLKTFDLYSPVPIVILEKNNTDIDWSTVSKKVGIISFD